MNIVIIGNFHFPFGSAAAARIRNLALGLEHCGAKVHIISLAPTATEETSSIKRFSNRISYEQLSSWQNKRNLVTTRNLWWEKPGWFIKMYSSIATGYKRLSQLIDKQECDLVIGYGRNLTQLAPLAQLCRKHGIVALLDVVEPSQQFNGFGGKLSPIYWDWYLGEKWMPELFSGVITITTELEATYRQLGCAATIVMPSIEGWNEPLPAKQPVPKQIFNLLYVGALLPRDTPHILFESMKILGEQHIPVRLQIVGKFNETPEGQRWVQFCKQDFILRENIQFIGRVNDQEMINQLAEADALILTRRNSHQEIASFPTRLVEYLKFGHPVFISDVGDIRHYLRDREDAILLDTEDATKVAQAIADVVLSADSGRQIGEQGRVRGAECFDRNKHAHRILEFARTLEHSQVKDN